MSDLPKRLCEQANEFEDCLPRPPRSPMVTPTLMREAADRIEYLESVAGAVTQAPDALPFAKRQRDG